jgi:hypothetical protein
MWSERAVVLTSCVCDRLAIGNESGLIIVDIVQKCCMSNIATPDLYGIVFVRCCWLFMKINHRSKFSLLMRHLFDEDIRCIQSIDCLQCFGFGLVINLSTNSHPKHSRLFTCRTFVIAAETLK